MSYRKIEPASPITFYDSPHDASKPYLVLTMAQVKSLRERGKFHAFANWARARARRAAPSGVGSCPAQHGAIAGGRRARDRRRTLSSIRSVAWSMACGPAAARPRRCAGDLASTRYFRLAATRPDLGDCQFSRAVDNPDQQGRLCHFGGAVSLEKS